MTGRESALHLLSLLREPLEVFGTSHNIVHITDGMKQLLPEHSWNCAVNVRLNYIMIQDARCYGRSRDRSDLIVFAGKR